LCERDSRLGFHSEAEGYKYFPEKIRWRMDQLQNTLAAAVPELETRIRNGESLFPEYTGEAPVGAVARAFLCEEPVTSRRDSEVPSGMAWQACAFGPDPDAARWAAGHDPETLTIWVSGPTPSSQESEDAPVSSILVKVEPRRLWPCKHFLFSPEAEDRSELLDQVAPQSVAGRVGFHKEGWTATIRIPWEHIGPEAHLLGPLRLDIRVQIPCCGTVSWRPNDPTTYRLRLGTDNPADLGWLVFEPNFPA
jgi:hypothetical protein